NRLRTTRDWPLHSAGPRHRRSETEIQTATFKETGPKGGGGRFLSQQGDLRSTLFATVKLWLDRSCCGAFSLNMQSGQLVCYKKRPSLCANNSENHMNRIEAMRLIPGRGEPIERGCVIMDDGKIVYARPAAKAPATPGAAVTEALVVMPGLWDC